MLKKVLNILLSKPIKKIKNDPFINRLRSTVIGEDMLHDGNIYFMNFGSVKYTKEILKNPNYLFQKVK